MVQNQVESFSSWEELIKGAPEGPVLGPILFNLNDLSYADDTTFHTCDNNLNNLIKRLKHHAFLAIE